MIVSGAMIWPLEIPRRLKPGAEIVTLEMVMLELLNSKVDVELTVAAHARIIEIQAHSTRCERLAFFLPCSL